MAELLEVARVLGIGTAAKPVVSEMDLLGRVGHGLPVKTVDRIVSCVAPQDAGFKYRLVPKATLARLKSGRQGHKHLSGGRLNAVQGALVARVASVWSQAVRIWKSPDAARDFLNRKHSLLGGRPPIDLVLENEIGADIVRSVLGRLEHGSAV